MLFRSRHSHRCDPFSVLAGRVFRYSQRFYLFAVLARILPIFGPHKDSTIFRNSSGMFFGTRTDFTFLRNSPEFFHFSILTQIRPFSGTRPDSAIFRYSHRFDPFWVLVGTVFRYSHGLYLFAVLARILPIFSTHTD